MIDSHTRRTLMKTHRCTQTPPRQHDALARLLAVALPIWLATALPQPFNL